MNQNQPFITHQSQLPSELKRWQLQTNSGSDDDHNGKLFGQKLFRQKLFRQYQFKNFDQAMEFMQLAANKFITPQDHHPSWQNTYSKLDIWLTTHDANHCITEKDLKLAKSFEKLWLEEYC